ncbi:hypothetical protein [Prosthecobacter sp.]|uniref:hypothetical protein n=1 Tax=Prosthecobacter sp. TaxID=1965333 RepID=UPI0037835D46
MKPIVVCFSILVLGMTLHAQDKAALNEIIAAFDETDAHFKEWQHYSYGAENLEGGASRIMCGKVTGTKASSKWR